MSRMLVRGARLVDPSQSLDEVCDILLQDGLVEAVGNRLPGDDAEIFEGAGLVATPGFIDMHVHLREPGFEYKETIATGCASAAAGGFTAVACMANTSPVNDNAAVTEFILRKAAQANTSRVHPIGAITKGLEGSELAEIGEMVEAGAVAISDDGHPVENPAVMRRAMEYSSLFDIPLIEHCETPELHPQGVMNESYWSTTLGLRGIPTASEEVSVQRNIVLTQTTGARFHVAHLSSAGSLASVRRAKQAGLRVTCEVTPHHLILTDAAVAGYDPNTKMKPPLCGETDRQALLDGLADGTVDAIATDHAPHHQDEKSLEFDQAPFGIVGLETAVPLCLDKLVGSNVITLSRLVELLSTAPARILGVSGGSLKVGSPADVTLLDLNASCSIDPTRFASRGRNTPFGGWQLRGRAVATIVGGKTVWRLAREA